MSTEMTVPPAALARVRELVVNAEQASAARDRYVEGLMAGLGVDPDAIRSGLVDIDFEAGSIVVRDADGDG